MIPFRLENRVQVTPYWFIESRVNGQTNAIDSHNFVTSLDIRLGLLEKRTFKKRLHCVGRAARRNHSDRVHAPLGIIAIGRERRDLKLFIAAFDCQRNGFSATILAAQSDFHAKIIEAQFWILFAHVADLQQLIAGQYASFPGGTAAYNITDNCGRVRHAISISYTGHDDGKDQVHDHTR